MSYLDQTLASLAPGVSLSRAMPGSFNPRHSLAIYVLPIKDYSPSGPGVVLGEALAARSGLGCTLLDGIPAKIPEGAVIAGLYDGLRAHNPALLADIPVLDQPGQYAIRLDRHATIVSRSVEGLASGMQTLAMLVLRHNEDLLPGALIVDNPLCHSRGLAVELQGGEVGINLLMQMLSFAATFKANHIQLIFDETYNPDREISGMDSFIHASHSYGIGVEVSFPWLGRILSGEMEPKIAWRALQAAALKFNAYSIVLDDPCPFDAPDERMTALVESMLAGEHAMPALSADATLFLRAGAPAEAMRSAGLTGWVRSVDAGVLPVIPESFPVRVDIQANLPGFSHRPSEQFHTRLDEATAWIRERKDKDLTISFRSVGVSHMWQNMLYPAATGLIAAWGNPDEGGQSAWIFSNLLYGDSSAAIMNMWNKISEAFPADLDAEEEKIVRQTALGHWPESERAKKLLADIDWLAVANNIHTAAESFKQTAGGLSRNTSTLTGAKLSLHALSWLHCFVVLAPELERRIREHDKNDDRAGTIAYELTSNFTTWHGHLENLGQESGLEIAEMPLLEAMGQRIRELCTAALG